MPLYEFRCTDCGIKFEKLLRMSAANNGVVCPECGFAAKRLISTFAAFRKSENGASSSIGGGCAGCSGGTCASCHH